jgi:hypothetical protein
VQFAATRLPLSCRLAAAQLPPSCRLAAAQLPLSCRSAADAVFGGHRWWRCCDRPGSASGARGAFRAVRGQVLAARPSACYHQGRRRVKRGGAFGPLPAPSGPGEMGDLDLGRPLAREWPCCLIHRIAHLSCFSGLFGCPLAPPFSFHSVFCHFPPPPPAPARRPQLTNQLADLSVIARCAGTF